MANANANRPGQNLGAGDARGLYKEKYFVEVMAAYQAACQWEGKFMEQTIDSGKSASFPISGLAGVGTHTPGAEILGRNVNFSEKVIVIDDTLISDIFSAKIDEMMSHYSTRSTYTSEQGKAMARLQDYQYAIMALLAARSAANIPGQTQAGTRLVNAAMKTDASVLAAAIFGARTTFDENGIPQEDVYAYLKPAQVALLVQNKDTINKLYGGSGSYADGDIFAVGGVPIQKTIHIPQINLTTDGQVNAAAPTLFGPATTAEVLAAKYRGDFSTTVGGVFHKGCVGEVKLGGMELEINYDARRRGTLIVTSQVNGKGVLRPECAIELATANLA